MANVQKINRGCISTKAINSAFALHSAMRVVYINAVNILAVKMKKDTQHYSQNKKHFKYTYTYNGI